MLVNHLRQKDGPGLWHTVAYGLHAVTGNLVKSKVAGTSPTHTITLQQMLGRGPWDGCEGLWWNGVEIKPDDYVFYPGTLSTGMADPVQGQDAVFDDDTPHSGIAWIRAELGEGFGDADTRNNVPEGLRGIFRTMKCWDYDAGGTELDLEYSTNPALQAADLMIRFGRIPPQRIDWEGWTIWRDFLAEEIEFDYTALAGFDGIGLTAKLYNGVDFDTLIKKRIDPVIEFVESAGSPGVGVNVDNFSVRWEGTIKPLYSETYTIYVTHTHGVRVWIDDLGTPLIDQWSSTGTHSNTIALAAGQHYDIRIDWKHTTGNAEFRFEWESTSQDREVVSHRCLYPKTEMRPRYETHPFFPAPTRLDDAVRTVLNLCNSTVQERNGRLYFYCLEQLAGESFHFTAQKIVEGSVTVTPRDLRTMRNSFQARFRDVESQYLEPPLDPIVIERPELIEIAGRKIDGDAVELYNTTHHQAYRTLDNIVRRVADSRFQITLTGMPDTWPVLAGDRVKLDAEFLDETELECLVLESNDASAEETADERTFVMQEWPDFQFAPDEP